MWSCCSCCLFYLLAGLHGAYVYGFFFLVLFAQDRAEALGWLLLLLLLLFAFPSEGGYCLMLVLLVLLHLLRDIQQQASKQCFGFFDGLSVGWCGG